MVSKGGFIPPFGFCHAVFGNNFVRMLPVRTFVILVVFLLNVPFSGLAQPANDECANAQSLALNSPVDCPFNGVSGTTLDATQDGSPPICDPDGVFLDVWYTVDIGPDTVLNLFLQPGPQITDYGIEVLDACGGNSIACGFTPQVIYSIEVQPFTTYIVRVTTNTDFGDPGGFVLCASVPDPIPDCDGAVIKTTTGETSVSTCIDGLADLIGIQQFSGSPAPYAFLLCTEGDTLVQVLSGDTLDADTLAAGIHHIWGLSYQGSLVGDQPGTPLSDIGSTGVCAELSNGPIMILADLCNGIGGDRSSSEAEALWHEGELMVRVSGRSGHAVLSVHDLLGRPLLLGRPISTGTWTPVSLPELARGALVVRVQGDGFAWSRLVPVP